MLGAVGDCGEPHFAAAGNHVEGKVTYQRGWGKEKIFWHCVCCPKWPLAISGTYSVKATSWPEGSCSDTPHPILQRVVFRQVRRAFGIWCEDEDEEEQMALSVCRKCEHSVSLSAETCPMCGVPNPCITPELPGCLSIIGVILLIAVLLRFFRPVR